jgi:hypothetical protein
MKSLTPYLAVAAAALVTGGLVATTVTGPEAPAEPAALKIPAAAPEQVRTQVVTRVVHRVHRVHLHPKRPHVAAAPAPLPRAAPAPAPAPAVVPRRVVVAAPAPTPNSTPARETGKPTLTTRTSGQGSGSRRDDDEGEREDRGEDEDRYEGGDD